MRTAHYLWAGTEVRPDGAYQKGAIRETPGKGVLPSEP